MDEQILLENLQWIFGHDDVGRAVRAEQYDFRWRAPARERGDDVEGGDVDPVKVFEDEDDRVVDGDPFQRFADLPHHPLARCPDGLAMQRFPGIRLYQRRKLDEPSRRVSHQRRHHRIALALAQQLTERFEYWVIRLLTSEALNALPAGDPEARSHGGATQKGVHERRLPRARLASNEDDLPATV